MWGLAFIAQKLVPTLWQGAVVMMDNCSIHKNNQELEALITAAGARIIYLPPYSSDFSPIENCWSKVKTILRRIGARTYPDLLKALETAFSEVITKDFLGWFTHCYSTVLDKTDKRYIATTPIAEQQD